MEQGHYSEEEDEGIGLGEESTKAAKEIGSNFLVMTNLALEKNLRMLQKPSKGFQILDIEDELFLVDFGDRKDKKKVLDICPWSFEKNPILL